MHIAPIALLCNAGLAASLLLTGQLALAQSDAAPLDRTVLPIAEPKRPVFTELDARNVVLAQATQPVQTQPPAPTPQERVAMLKQELQASQAQLRAYEWIETTVISKGGEEKSRKRNTCYYSVDGTLQKVPVADGAEPESSGPRGPLRKRIAAQKKEEITEYMQQAIALVHSYVPPDPNRIQQVVNAGKLTVNVIEPGRRVRLEFGDYMKSGDVLSVDIELPTNRLLGMHVSSYLDTAKDAVQLDVAMGVLPDGTIYAANTTLDARAKEILVAIENSGYHRVGG
ncbi:MAG: hypothetical protein V3U59_03325 [Gammaproteobacteria bacterium]